MTKNDQTYWNALPVPGVVVNGQGKIHATNPAAELFFNTSDAKLIGQKLEQRLRSDTELAEVIVRVRSDHSPVLITKASVIVDRQAPVVSDIHLAPLAAEPDDLVLVVLQPRHSGAQLDQRNALRSSARSAIGMAEMLAHEIKNPLAGVTGAAQLLAMGLNEQDRELTDLIVAESRRIVALLDQVEQFGNLQPPQRRAVNIHDILERARKSAELGFAGAATILQEYDPSLPQTDVDSDQMMQVILNLLKNAVEAGGVNGSNLMIRSFFDRGLRRRTTDGKANALPIQVEIIDDGPGLPADLAGDIFDPFVSGRENGTGLGLALVSKIISDHDALIGVTSEPGRTVFRLSLPVAESRREPNRKDT